jgi:hypothetical protein
MFFNSDLLVCTSLHVSTAHTGTLHERKARCSTARVARFCALEAARLRLAACFQVLKALRKDVCLQYESCQRQREVHARDAPFFRRGRAKGACASGRVHARDIPFLGGMYLFFSCCLPGIFLSKTGKQCGMHDVSLLSSLLQVSGALPQALRQ